MKTLNDYIRESILDDEDVLMDKSIDDSNPIIKLYNICEEKKCEPGYLEFDKEFRSILKQIKIPKDSIISTSKFYNHPELIYIQRELPEEGLRWTPKKELFSFSFPKESTYWDESKYRVFLTVNTHDKNIPNWDDKERKKEINKFTKKYNFKKHPKYKEGVNEFWVIE